MELDDLCGVAVLLDGPQRLRPLLGAASKFGGSPEPIGRTDGERLIGGNGVKKIQLGADVRASARPRSKAASRPFVRSPPPEFVSCSSFVSVLNKSNKEAVASRP